MPVNFLTLIGGPAKYNGCDPAHDKTWNNYFGLAERAARQGPGKGVAGETVHWLLFAPSYRQRFDADDYAVPGLAHLADRKQLIPERNAQAEKVKAAGHADYVAMIRQTATDFGFTFKEIETPDQFWDYFGLLPNGSVSRVWYVGHASDSGLMLNLLHDAQCSAASNIMIRTDSLFSKQPLKIKFAAGARESEFFGCNTTKFAAEWKRVFGVPAAGAKGYITFKVLKGGGDVLHKVRTTPATSDPLVWERY